MTLYAPGDPPANHRPTSHLPTRADVIAAAERLHGLVVRTPVLRCPALDAAAGAELWLKAENLQRIGAFKARGAFHSMERLSPEVRRRGVITYSSGNHAQAVALAAHHFGVPADIAMPVDAPRVKVAVVESLGARVVFAGRTSTERHAAALEIQARTGGAIIEPFDHPDTIAGQGTATLELCEEVAAVTGGESLDALVVPVGGGGLLAGACLAADPETAIFTAEPIGCDSMARSLAVDEVVAVEPGPTLCDGLKPTEVGRLPLAIARRRVAGSYLISDDEVGRALVTLLLQAKVLCEPSAAAALAVAMGAGTLAFRRPGASALHGNGRDRPQRIGVLLSGGNVAPDLLADLVRRYG